MLRLCCSTARRTPGKFLRSPVSKSTVRHSSSQGGFGAGTKVLGGTLLLTGATAGATVGYAGFDPEFRTLLESQIPGVDQALDLVLGPAQHIPIVPTKSTPSKLKISSVMVTKPKTEEIEALPPLPPVEVVISKEIVPSTDANTIEEVPDVVEVIPPIVDVPLASVEPTHVEEPLAPVEELITPVEEPPALAEEAVAPVEDHPPVTQQESEPISPPAEDITVPEDVTVDIPMPKLEVPEPSIEPVSAEEAPEAAQEEGSSEQEEESLPLKLEELTPEIENTSLETVLSELSKEMKEAVENAVKGYEVASESVLNHINIMQKVLESNVTVKDDNAWNTMFEAAIAKSDALKAVEITEKQAIAAIDNVIESISAGRKNNATSTNLELIVAEEAANRAIFQLDQAKSKGSAIQTEARVMEDYRDLVEAGRQEFHKEMASIMPDVKLGEKSGKLTEDELNMFITHAYKKVLFLQQELAKQQTLEQERFKKALEKQRVEIQLLAADKVDHELEIQKRELEVEHERRMAAIRDEAEREMRAQLRRQAAAHSDHLADVLSVQEAELTRHHGHDLDEKLSGVKEEYINSLASLSGSVTGLTSALKARSEADKSSLVAQTLWLACTGLKVNISQGQSQVSSWDAKLLPLAADVAKIRNVVGDQDEFVDVVLGSLSPVSLERGVYTEDSLKERFVKVEKVARRVANIGDQGGSLFSYGLSYLQSLLLVDLSQRLPSENEEPLDPSKLSSTDLVNLARHSLDRNDLARAVQYVNLLRGEPGRVARDWLEEARLTLEVNQVAEVLVSHAEARGVECLPA